MDFHTAYACQVPLNCPASRLPQIFCWCDLAWLCGSQRPFWHGKLSEILPDSIMASA